MESLLRAAQQGRSPWMPALIILALETAMRRSEVLNLTWRDINLEKRTATVTESKNGKPRGVPLPPRAVEALNALPDSGDGRVFPMNGHAAYRAWTRILERANRLGEAEGAEPIEGLLFHDLGSEGVSRFFEETDMGPMEVRSITGHSSHKILDDHPHLAAENFFERVGDRPSGPL